jgi:hypothetical protein
MTILDKLIGTLCEQEAVREANAELSRLRLVERLAADLVRETESGWGRKAKMLRAQLGALVLRPTHAKETKE